MAQTENRPEFSIVIPVYNTEKYLGECIDSIISQSFSDFEVILVDDGSSDSSLEICRKYESDDSRIKVIHKENSGVSSARNMGIDAASGKYITFIDSDDWILPGALQFVHDRFSSTDSGIVVVSIRKISGKKSKIYCPIEDKTGPLLQMKYPFAIGGYFFRLDIIKDNGLKFMEKLAYSEDRVFILSLSPYCRNITTCSDVFYIYRSNAGAATSSKNGVRIMENQFKASKQLFKMARNPLYEKSKQQLIKNAHRTMKWGVYAIVKHCPTKQGYNKMKDLFSELFATECEHPHMTYYRLLLTRHYLVYRQAVSYNLALASSKLKMLIF